MWAKNFFLLFNLNKNIEVLLSHTICPFSDDKTNTLCIGFLTINPSTISLAIQLVRQSIWSLWLYVLSSYLEHNNWFDSNWGRLFS